MDKIGQAFHNSHKVYMQSKPIKPGDLFVHRVFCGLVIAGCEAFLQWLRSVSARIMDANCEAELRATFLKGPRKIPWANTQESRHKSLITFDGFCLWDLYLWKNRCNVGISWHIFPPVLLHCGAKALGTSLPGKALDTPRHGIEINSTFASELTFLDRDCHEPLCIGNLLH